MSKFHKLSLMTTTTLLTTMLLSGCQIPELGSLLSNNQQEQNASPTTQPASSTDNPADSTTQAPPSPAENTSQVDLSTLPDSLVLAPGANWKLPQADGLQVDSSSSAVKITDGVLSVPKDAQIGDVATVGISYQGATKNVTVTIKSSLTDTVQTVTGVPTVTNPSDIMVVVNKQRSLPSTYIPEGLVEPNVPFSFPDKSEKRLLRPEAAKALEELFAGAKQDGIELYGVSGYRAYKTQKGLFDTYVKTQGQEHASQYSAVPGKSEHQTGLAIDVSGADSKTRLEEPFADTIEGKWLKEHASEYGFIIRYLKGKEAITGYAFEPWHIRYVGKKAAREISQKGLTLEEYFQDAVPASKSK